MRRASYLPFGKPSYTEAEVEAVSEVMRSGWIGMGEQTIFFEEELASYVGIKNVVTVNSCTSALFLSLLVSGVKPGDEVICPSFTWCATANTALYLGAIPVFCDIDADTLCASTDSIVKKCSDKTKAVVVVHFAGYAIDVEKLRAVLPAHISIIEDAAHALGSRYSNGMMVGSSGNLTCFSFYANKNLSTGEGGAICVADNQIAEHLRSLRLNALSVNAWQRFITPQSILFSGQLTELGYKMNYTDMQASIGRVQLRRMGEMQARRIEIAGVYTKRLQTACPQVRLQKNCAGAGHAHHLYVVLPPDNALFNRDRFILNLRAQNIGATVHYLPLHLMPLYLDKSGKADQLAVTEQLAKVCVSLPISASMSLDDAEYVIENVVKQLREMKHK